jgi:hypothetical protein
MALTAQIPIQYDKPQIRAEWNFDYKIRGLYIHLDIQIKKVTQLVAEINLNWCPYNVKWIKLSRKVKFQLKGESDLLRMMDTSRAIPNTPKIDPNIPRVE